MPKCGASASETKTVGQGLEPFQCHESMPNSEKKPNKHAVDIRGTKWYEKRFYMTYMSKIV